MCMYNICTYVYIIYYICMNVHEDFFCMRCFFIAAKQRANNSKEMRATRKRWEQREKDKINYYLLRCINCKRKRGIYFCHVHSLTSHVSYMRTTIEWRGIYFCHVHSLIFVMLHLMSLTWEHISCLLHSLTSHVSYMRTTITSFDVYIYEVKNLHDKSSSHSSAP